MCMLFHMNHWSNLAARIEVYRKIKSLILTASGEFGGVMDILQSITLYELGIKCPLVNLQL